MQNDYFFFLHSWQITASDLHRQNKLCTVTPCEKTQNQEEKVAWILYAKAPSHEEWLHICTLALDMVMGQLHTFSAVSHQKVLLVLNEEQAGHSEKQRNLFSLLRLKPQILHGTYNIA
jgi:hypothetical protein